MVNLLLFGGQVHRTLNWRVKDNYKFSQTTTSNLVSALKFNQSIDYVNSKPINLMYVFNLRSRVRYDFETHVKLIGPKYSLSVHK
jgi:hypothetical protein